MDLRGLGESPAPEGERENHPYPNRATEDVRTALEYLARERGIHSVVLLGLCSGAHAAFHATIELADHGIVDTVLINPLTYRWVEGMSLETTVAAKHFQEVAHYKNSLRDPRKWLKLARGKVKVGHVAQLARTQVMQKLQSLRPSQGDTELARDLRRILEQQRSLTLFVARQDPGYELLVAGAGKLVKKAERMGKLSATFIDGADHTFSSSGPRGELIARIKAHLSTVTPTI
jgi:hypothetical protein